MSLVAYGDSSSDSEAEEGPEPPADAAKSDVRKLLGLLPPPKGSKPSGKHPVRISIPTVKSGKDSDDEEEESTQVKRVKIKGGASRLTALLPEPKSHPKQLGALRRSTTQTMVPYTLSKRRQDSIKSEKLKAKRTKSRGGGKVATSPGDAGSDSDEEPVSFFSHLEETETDASSSSGTVVAPLKVSGPVFTTPSASESLSPATSSEERATDSTQIGYPATSNQSFAGYVEGSYHQIPYDSSQQQERASGYSWERFSSQAANSAPANSAPYTAQPYIPPQHSTGGRTDTANTPTDVADGDGGESGEPSEAGASGEGGAGGEGGEGGEKVMEGTGPGVIIDQEALRRLAGGSHKRRGREDALNNIVDILGDEVMEDVRVYQRHYGEDPSITKLYKVDNSKLKTPTSNQKRKHQITWLAHEAKERELDLQKHWAVGSQARKDSRSKYGF